MFVSVSLLQLKFINPEKGGNLKLCEVDSDCREFSPCGMGISCWNQRGYEKEYNSDYSCPHVEIMPWQIYRYNRNKCICSNNKCTKVYSKEKYCNSLNASLDWCKKGKPINYSYYPEETECESMRVMFDKECNEANSLSQYEKDPLYCEKKHRLCAI